MHGRAGAHVHPVLGQLRVDEGTELGVDRREDLFELLHLRHGQTSCHQGLGHLQADVAGPDDDGVPRCALLEGAHDRERVAHGVQQVDAVVGPEGVGTGQPLDGRPNRDGTGAHDQRVVGHEVFGPVGPLDRQLVRLDVDPAGDRVEMQLHACRLQVGHGAMRQVAPMRHLPRHVIGDTADGEVGVRVGNDDGDLDGAVELPGAQGP